MRNTPRRVSVKDLDPNEAHVEGHGGIYRLFADHRWEGAYARFLSALKDKRLAENMSDAQFGLLVGVGRLREIDADVRRLDVVELFVLAKVLNAHPAKLLAPLAHAFGFRLCRKSVKRAYPRRDGLTHFHDNKPERKED